MSESEAIQQLKHRADDAIQSLSRRPDSAVIENAKNLVVELRNIHDFERMGALAEVISRHDPKDATNRRLYGQYLIETHRVTAAIDVLKNLSRRVSVDEPEGKEARGLLGRAYKQVYFDAVDKTSDFAIEALRNAIKAYEKPFKHDKRNTWHGVNYLALLDRAKRIGLGFSRGRDTESVSSKILEVLDDVPENQRDEWHLPTAAEAALGLNNWDEVHSRIRAYASRKDVPAFLINSTLRQFRDVWQLQDRGPEGRELIQILTARLASIKGSFQEISAKEIKSFKTDPGPSDKTLQATLGDLGTQTFRWWRKGLFCAEAVAAIYKGPDQIHGTGFLVRAGDIGLEPPDERVVLTNFHVVNLQGTDSALRPEDATVGFEAVDDERVYQVETVLWSSGTHLHDASVLRLAKPLDTEVKPLRIARSLPLNDPSTLVYVIGHPEGKRLSFSFQDNHLIDHEGPPGGSPTNPDVRRVHYHAPTRKGNSGSPVFNTNSWQVIALHRAGHDGEMQKLNGRQGTYSANEGISIGSIKSAIEKVRDVT